MSRNYDNWERLVKAVLDREKLRQLARLPSFDSTISNFSFDSTSTLKEYGPEVPKIFSYNELLKKATGNFRPVHRREGRSWYDFKGWIYEHTLTAATPRSGLAISVKLFKDDKQWLSELTYAMQLCHPNLVKFIGYCSEGNNRLSVYEFMPRGSTLEMHLLGGSGRREMTWERRVNVAIGVARGLSFLHHRETTVINWAIRASRIFIDEDFNAKLNGFSLVEPEAAGVARGNSVHPNYFSYYQHVVSEYIISGLLTAKSNVYSFGIVLLQLLCGRPTLDPTRVPGEQKLVNWATSSYLKDKKKLFQIMDSKLEGKYHRKDAYAVAALARQCLCLDPRIRPSMMEVLAALEHLKLSSKS